MAETRWKVVDPQNRIRRLDPVTDGTVNVELTLPGDDPAVTQAIEAAAAQAGVELQRVPPDMAQAMRAQAESLARIPFVTIDGVEYRPVG